ncbi:DUF559 domain-containing protein [Archangium gephyra]|uniref:DUF559 domain-containing protein n=1 Tax=Archangium gephyra TaxID=48 RepID=UPI0035D48D23
MKVFLCWSKERSRAIAVALKNWLPKVIQNCEPWMSATDVLAGQRWDVELAQKLDESSVGILCVTPENHCEPWLNFEAGAISKKVGANSQSHVAPYLLGYERPGDLPLPLGQFQAKLANKEGTFELLQMINSVEDKPLTADSLREFFGMWWPSFEKELQRVSKMPGGSPESMRRPDDEKLDELLVLSRTLLSKIDSQPLHSMNEAVHAESVDAGFRESSARTLSSAEHFLYEVLQHNPVTKDLFSRNERVEVGGGERPVEVDFLCRELKLAVEIDGYYHFRNSDAFRRDRRKDVVLQRAGYLVVRFLAEDVVTRLEEILSTIEFLIVSRRR